MHGFGWDDLRFFLAVAREGTLTGAARRLRTDHTTVGRRIRGLEESLVAKLFDRHTTGYTLAPLGHALLQHAERMEAVAISAQAIIEEINRPMSGLVRIGATDGFGAYFIAPRLGKLSNLHPSLEIQLLAMPRIFSLSRREADLAIGLAQPEEGRLYSRKLMEYELGVYASGEYLDRSEAVVKVEDLRCHPFVSYVDELIYAKELNYIPRVDPAIRPSLKSSNPIAQLKAIVSGFGLGVLPCFMADPEPLLRRVLADKVVLHNTFWLITHADLRRLSRVRTVADFIYREVNAERALFLPSAVAN
ncbi:MAG: LysR family transcriptional regulator [Hyphomicrobium sp. SCN 65-11]|nr:MAG: LysR family transcriptional regulator [Hyphomicrobium sp. SCN 65-11]